MSHRQKMQLYLERFDIAMAVEDFTALTSNIYHAFEAENYDERHFSIAYSKKYWSEVTLRLAAHFKSKANITALDFGCGTGFATEQLLASGLDSKLVQVSCYDLSEDMVAVCQQKFGSDARIAFYAGQEVLKNLIGDGTQYDIIVCNALMHHILEPSVIFEMIDQLLKPGGIFVMGHEPNKRFYQNNTLQRLSKLFRLYKKASRKIQKRNRKIGRDIALATLDELVKKQIVPAHFPAAIIPKFVDIHVPISNFENQPWGELGFDLSYINQFLSSEFNLIDQITYSHIKDQEAYRSAIWTPIAELFAVLFPKDGADAIFVFEKRETS